MRISELARRAGVKLETIRFYERENVLREPPRTSAGYRVYSEGDLHQVIFVRKCQHLGFTLKEIKQLSGLHDLLAASRNQDSASLQGLIAMAGERLDLIDGKIRELQDMRAGLANLMTEARSLSPTQCPGRQVSPK